MRSRTCDPSHNPHARTHETRGSQEGHNLRVPFARTEEMCSNPHPLSIEIPKHTKPTLAARTSSVRLAENHGVPAEAESTMVRRVRLGALETTRNTWPDIVYLVPFTASAPPYYTRGASPPPRSSGNFLACWAHSFGGLPGRPVIGRDNMSGLKNWAVFSSGSHESS